MIFRSPKVERTSSDVSCEDVTIYEDLVLELVSINTHGSLERSLGWQIQWDLPLTPILLIRSWSCQMGTAGSFGNAWSSFTQSIQNALMAFARYFSWFLAITTCYFPFFCMYSIVVGGLMVLVVWWCWWSLHLSYVMEILVKLSSMNMIKLDSVDKYQNHFQVAILNYRASFLSPHCSCTIGS